MRIRFDSILLGACILCAATAPAGLGSGSKDGLLQGLPVPVRRTILAEVASGTLDSVNRTNGDAGEVIYDADFTRAGKSRNLTVALDGQLLDMSVFLDETPPAVRAAFRTLGQGAQLGAITKNIGENDDFTYEVELTRDGVTRACTVDEKGVLLEMQVLLPETPASVQQAIGAKAGGAILGDITKTLDGGEVNYDVMMTKAGRRRSFTVSAAGKLVEEQVFAEETPGAVQKALQSQAARGRLGKINQSTDGGKTNYQVALTIGPATTWMTFDAAGALASEEQDIVWASLPARVKIALHPLEVAGEEIKDITRTTEGTNTTYDIELSKGQNRRTLTLDPNGNILPP